MNLALPLRGRLGHLEQLSRDFAAGKFGQGTVRLLVAVWACSTLLLFLFRPGYAFPPFEVIDSWVYTGYQWDPRGHLSEFGPLYYGSRFTLILPGAILHSLLPPLAANIAYKLLESALLGTAFALIAFGSRRLSVALLAVALSVLCPQIIVALHTDYMDMAVILYGALTLAGITVAKDSRHWVAWILMAGVAFACMTVSNLSAFAMPGLGLAAYHVLWTNWGLRRQLVCSALYIGAALVVLATFGLISRQLGGQFLFLRPQIEMIFYFHHNPQNPWTPPNWEWLKIATWLVVPGCALAWGLARAGSRRPDESPTHLLTRALTGGLAVSLAVAMNMEIRGAAVLAYNFYACLQLCLALPLLAVCGAGQTDAGGLRWPLAMVCFLALGALWGNSLSAAALVQRYLPFPILVDHIPVLAAIALLATAAIFLWLPPRFRQPQLLALCIVACSLPLGFHGPTLSDRLPERYAAIHRAFQTLAREFPQGSYRFWIHPAQADGTSLASTRLYGYRLFSWKNFPEFENPTAPDLTIIIPTLPGQGATVLEEATAVMDRAKLDLVNPRLIPIPGQNGTGFDLVCFSLESRSDEAKRMIDVAEQGTVVMDLQFTATPPYTDEMIQTTFQPAGAKTIDVRQGYPTFTPTDRQDYLWTAWHPIPSASAGETRQLTLIADMPVTGYCLCVVQTEGYHEIRRIALTKKGRTAHSISVPPDAHTLRIYFKTDSGQPTALPTRLTIYSPR